MLTLNSFLNEETMCIRMTLLKLKKKYYLSNFIPFFLFPCLLDCLSDALSCQLWQNQTEPSCSGATHS